MRTRLKLDFWLTAFALAVPMLAHGMQENLPDLEGQVSNTIEIEYPAENLLPYRERRPDWGFVAGVKYENFTPTAYRSAVDGASFSSIAGSKSFELIGPEFGAKFNFSIGSLIGTASYAQSQLSGKFVDSTGPFAINMSVTRTALHAGYFMDTIWPEPYVVPYAQLDFMNMTYEEKDTVGSSVSGNREGIVGFTGGVLVQLNWMDPGASFDSLDIAGIKNSYLDLSLSKIEDPKLGNDLDWGVGLLLEF